MKMIIEIMKEGKNQCHILYIASYFCGVQFLRISSQCTYISQAGYFQWCIFCDITPHDEYLVIVSTSPCRCLMIMSNRWAPACRWSDTLSVLSMHWPIRCCKWYSSFSLVYTCMFIPKILMRLIHIMNKAKH